MEEEQIQIKQPNKYIAYIKNNKYNVYFVVAISVLILLIIAMVIVTINHKDLPSSNTTTKTSPTQTISPTLAFTSGTPSSTTIQVTTPEPTEAALIENQIQPQITPYVAVPYTVSSIEKFGDNWAVMSLTNPDVGGAGVITKKVNGEWQVVAGPASLFPTEQLQSIGAPQALIDSLTNTTSPTPAP